MRILILLCFLLLSGCAQKQIIITDENLKPIKELQTANIKVTNSPKLNVLAIEDLRPNRDSVGIAYMGVLNSETPVRMESPLHKPRMVLA